MVSGGPPQPDDTGPAGFVAALRQLRAWSGRTYRELAAAARARGQYLPASTVASALGRSTVPKASVVEAFARACGLDEATVAQWLAARATVAARAATLRPVVHRGAAEPAVRRGGDPRPATLPPDTADFTGRLDQLEQLDEHLTGAGRPGRHGTAVAVTAIAGMAGVGKTAFAVHLAHRLVGAFPDGQLYVNLRGAEAAALDPGEVLARFLRALGVDSRAIPADPTERSALYRMRLAGRRVLIVLDNAAGESQVRPLLPGTPTAGVVITSRQRLAGLEGARLVDLDVLPPDEAVRLLERVVGDDRPGRRPADAAEIVRLCGRLPLAVRIAGARLAARPAWRLVDLAERLRDAHQRLDHLVVGDLAVRASLTLSYRGLDEETRQLFQLLGLFDVPDFPAWLPTLLPSGGPDRAGAAVERLVDAQLLAVAGVDDAGQLRYRFHDLVRLFAVEAAERERSEQERLRALRRGFGGWLAVAEHMAAQVPGPLYAPISGRATRSSLTPPADQVLRADAQAWFDSERVTLQCVIREAVRLGDHELAFDLAGCMEKHSDLRGMYLDWAAINAEVMAACRHAGNHLGEAAMLRGLIDVTTWTTDRHDEEAMGRQRTEAFRLLEMFVRLGHGPGESDAAVMCAWACAATGEHHRAVELATRALRVAERSGHRGGEIRAHLALAVARFELNDLPAAVAHAARALDAARALGNARGLATALQFCGIAHRELGDFPRSSRLLDESLSISRQYHDDYTETLTMLALARLHLQSGDPRARQEAEASLALSRQYGLPHHRAESLQLLGEIELAGNRPTDAVGYLEQSVDIWRSRGWHSFQAAALTSLGRAYLCVDRSAARTALAEAVAIYSRLGHEDRATEVRRMLPASGTVPDVAEQPAPPP